MSKRKLSVLPASMIILMIMSISMQGFAQGYGSLSGKVTDLASGEILPYANITIAGTTIGTVSDNNGEYMLPRLREGKHSISCQFLGYVTVTRDITVMSGENLVLDFVLESKHLTLEEVVVSVQAYGQTKALNQQLNSDAVVNVLSEEKIKELPDVNLAEAIGRLPGIALQRSGGEGQKVIIRGLEPNYATVTVNGMRMASSESGNRSTNLSLISSDMLSSVEVVKSPTPDMDGDAIAGIVNLGVRKASADPTLRVKVANVYNAYRNDPLNYQASVIAGKRFFDQKIGIVVEANAENLNRGLDFESSDLETYQPEKDLPFIWTSYSQQRKFEDRNRYGASLSMDYTMKNGDITFNGMYGKTQSHVFSNEIAMNVDERRLDYISKLRNSDRDVWTAALMGNHKVLNLHLDWGLSTSRGKSYIPFDYDHDFRLYTGITAIPQDLRVLAPVHWDTAANPDFLETELRGFSKDKSRTTSENILSAFFNIEIPLSFTDNIGGWLKAGVKYQQTMRESTEDVWRSPGYEGSTDRVNRFIANYPYSLTPSSTGGISLINFLDTEQGETDFLGGQTDFHFPADEELMRLAYDSDRDNFDHIAPDGLPETYTADERVMAAYTMFRLHLGQKLTVIPGVRFELMEGEYQSWVVDGVWDSFDAEERHSSSRFPELLPHFHVKYEPLPWMDVRFVYNKTLSRPKYDQLRPYGKITSQNDEHIRSGNPGLQQAVSSNFDMNVAVYESRFGLFSIGAFHKDIKNNFYRRSNFMLYNDSIATVYGFPGYDDYTITRFENADARVWGAEAELQANFNFLPYPLNGLILSLNYARLFSETTVQNALKFKEVIGVDPMTGVPIMQTVVEESYRTLAMPDQTPHIFNASLGYDYKGFSSRISFIYQGLRITSVSNKGLDDYNLDTYQMDVSLKQKFGKRLSVYLNLNNLFNLRKDIDYSYDIYYKTSEEQWGMTVFTGLIFDL
ncbi:MAG: TonB-dependent receptor [Bacteroidetes bacterium]|nr:TonB-dependent receptor [Bacteroidota bacterium]